MTHVHIINALEVTILYVILLKMKDSCGAAAEPLTENGEDGWFGRFGENPPLPSLEGMLQRRGLSDLYSHPFRLGFGTDMHKASPYSRNRPFGVVEIPLKAGLVPPERQKANFQFSTFNL